MTPHTLQTRTDAEVLWWQRRDVIKSAGAWVATGGMSAAIAQQRTNVVQLTGKALLNGRRLMPDQWIQTGDEIRTGPNSTLIFALGTAAFMVRQNTLLTVERGVTLSTVSVLRLFSGGVASVWGAGNRTIITPTLTAEVKGSGLYAEVRPFEDSRTYFCNCYGSAQLNANGSKQQSRSDYHQAFWAEALPSSGSRLRTAPYIEHTDEELEFLARLIGDRPHWQILGRKGSPDGRGSLGAG